MQFTIQFHSPFQYQRADFGFIKQSFSAQLLSSGGQNEEAHLIWTNKTNQNKKQKLKCSLGLSKIVVHLNTQEWP